MNVRTEAPARAERLDIIMGGIEIDGSTQGRVRIDQGTVDEYVRAIEKGAKFPPVELFHDGITYWVGDGFHRILANATLGKVKIKANVRPGGQRSALRWALGANAEHGLKRTAEDKRKAVELALEEFPEESDRSIARMCKVSPTTVGTVKASKAPASVQMDSNKAPAPAEAIAMVCSWSSPWVDIETIPTVNELKDGVDYKNVGTWEELIEGRGVPTKTADIAKDADVPPGKEDCRGKRFILVERQVAIDAIQNTEPILDIFRVKPVSAGHTERVEKAKQMQERLAIVDEAMNDLRLAIGNRLTEPTEHLNFLYELLVTTAHPAAAELAGNVLALPIGDAMSMADNRIQKTFISIMAIAGGQLRNRNLEECEIYNAACKLLRTAPYNNEG